MIGYTIDNQPGNSENAWLYIPEYQYGDLVLRDVAVRASTMDMGFRNIVCDGSDHHMGRFLAKALESPGLRNVRRVEVPVEVVNFVGKYVGLLEERVHVCEKVRSLFGSEDRL